ncbi:hypothetical protein [Streptomyces europaeiscabiei]|uniref:DUF7691 family protein n=1 Tax=Streptomyces europaeiscabiei TaxID=146819 RepID=UPI002E176944
MSPSPGTYLLDVAAARALIGSRDAQLPEDVRGRFGDDLDRDDEWVASKIEDGVSPTLS